MTTAQRDLDGRVAQGWGGDAPNGVHVNLILARRGSPTAAAMISAYAAPSEGFTPVLACAGKDQRSYETILPATIIVPKSIPGGNLGETLLFGAVRGGSGQAVLDAVADGLLPGDQEHLVFVSVWIDPAADSEPVVRAPMLGEHTDAVLSSVLGMSPAEIERLHVRGIVAGSKGGARV